MIPYNKLNQIQPGQRRRKLALCFGAIERDILGIFSDDDKEKFENISRENYLRAIVQIVIDDPKLSLPAKEELQNLLSQEKFDELRICNVARNHLLSIIGAFPAEWDLIISPHSGNSERKFYKNVFVYAEDIRSPFNLGTIFRTAEAMGVEKLFLSEFCCDENHPRAVRSAMGCTKVLPYERISLKDLILKLPKDFPVFVLETGGEDISLFNFPQEGLVILGSEELGVSPEALELCKHKCVTIPLSGVKASLNVGVAFGIMLQNWISSI